jgi:hypothetical protein
MLHLSILLLALLIGLAITARADTSGCTQVSNLSTARVRWATLRQDDVDPVHNEENCRWYATSFFEAVTARQAASFCKEGIVRERTLQSLDSDINAFNHLIGTLCSQDRPAGASSGPESQTEVARGTLTYVKARPENSHDIGASPIPSSAPRGRAM